MQARKIAIASFALFFILGLNAPVFASELPAAGLTPDSPFYFLKTWKEAIQTFFTFGGEAKAKQYLHLADVRLAEYQKMVEAGKTEIADKTLSKYENQLNRAITKVQELEDNGQDVSNLLQKAQGSVAKHLEVLEANLQKAPKQARQGIQNAIENSQKGLDNILNKQKPVIVISPNGGETWNKGQKVKILWRASAEIKDINIRLAILTNGEGQSFNAAIASKIPSSGSYEWIVQDLYSEVLGIKDLPASDRYSVTIEDSEHSNVYDSSDAPFTIAEAN